MKLSAELVNKINALKGSRPDYGSGHAVLGQDLRHPAEPDARAEGLPQVQTRTALKSTQVPVQVIGARSNSSPKITIRRTTPAPDAIPSSQEDQKILAFERFHRENPHVYETLLALAREWVAETGATRASISALYERARWDLAVKTNDAEYALNNNHKAFYSRLIMTEPGLAGLFNTRTSAADSRSD